MGASTMQFGKGGAWIYNYRLIDPADFWMLNLIYNLSLKSGWCDKGNLNCPVSGSGA